MALNFPSSPSLNQTYTIGSKSWRWNGTGWQIVYDPAAGILTTKGDLLTFGSSSQRKGVGSDGKILIADSAQTDGLAWGGVHLHNRLINPNIIIDQRNTAGTPKAADGSGNAYGPDRWHGVVSAGGGSEAFAMTQVAITDLPGFLKAIQLNVTTANASPAAAANTYFGQKIEGLNVADIAFGTANAKPVVLRFYVFSAITGTFGGQLLNNAANRSYVFQYTINATNTWEEKVIVIPGDTSGTWTLFTNTTGLYVLFDVGSGSSAEGTANAWQAGNIRRVAGNARFISATGTPRVKFTGFDLRTADSPLEREVRPYGLELALCQRYYWNTQGQPPLLRTETATTAYAWYESPVTMRTAATWSVANAATANVSAGPSVANGKATGAEVSITGLGTGGASFAFFDLVADAEL